VKRAAVRGMLVGLGYTTIHVPYTEYYYFIQSDGDEGIKTSARIEILTIVQIRENAGIFSALLLIIQTTLYSLALPVKERHTDRIIPIRTKRNLAIVATVL
jgi:hypothetical protein